MGDPKSNSLARSTGSSGKSGKSASFREPVEERRKGASGSSTNVSENEAEKKRNDDSDVDENSLRAYRG